jgi:hypothetical protein
VPPQQVCTALEVEVSPSHAPTPRRAERVLRVAGAGQELPVQLPLDGGGVGHPLAHEDVDRLEAALVPCHLLAMYVVPAATGAGSPQISYGKRRQATCIGCIVHPCAAADIGYALCCAQPVPTKTSIVWKPHWSFTSFLAMRLRLCRRSTETRPLTMRLCRRSTEPRGVSSPWLRTAGAGTLAPGQSDPCNQLCRRPLSIMQNPFTGVQDSSHLGAQLRDNVRLRA